MHARDLYRALRGEDSYFSRARRRVRLRSGLVTSRYFGANPPVRLADLEDSLARLQADEKVMPLDRAGATRPCAARAPVRLGLPLGRRGQSCGGRPL